MSARFSLNEYNSEISQLSGDSILTGAGRFVVHDQAAEPSRHWLVWDKETLSVSVAAWEANIPIDASFNIWQHIDNEEVPVKALNNIKPILSVYQLPGNVNPSNPMFTASDPGQARHWTFVGPYSLIITTTVDRQSSVEVQVFYGEIPLASLVLHGIPAMAAGRVEIIYSVAAELVGRYELEMILRLVHLSSEVRASQQVLSGAV